MTLTQYVQVDVGLTADIQVPEFDDELYLGNYPELQKVVARIGDNPSAIEDEVGNIGVIDAEVVRPAGIGGGESIVKVIMDDPHALKIATLPGVYVELTVDIYNERVFTGELIKVTQNEEGVVTMTAQDARRDLLSYTVRLDTRPKGVPSTVMIRNLLIEDGPFDTHDVIIDYPDSTSSSLEHDELPGPDSGDTHVTRPVNIRMNVGTDYQPTLYQVVRDVARVQHAYAYIDEYNRFHFRPIPKISGWTPEYLVTLNAGDSSATNERTIVEAPRTDLLSGTFGSEYVNSEAVKAEAKTKNGNKSKARRIRDQNIQSVQSANNTAVDDQLIHSLSTDSGTVTSVGHPLPVPFDHVILDDLPPWSPLPEGKYTITEVKHKVNATDGYLTDVSVGKDLESIYKSILDNGMSDVVAKKVAEPNWEALQGVKEMREAYFPTNEPHYPNVT